MSGLPQTADQYQRCRLGPVLTHSGPSRSHTSSQFSKTGLEQFRHFVHILTAGRGICQRAHLIEDLNWISDRVSGRVWTICVGVLAFCVTFVIQSIEAEEKVFLEPESVIGPMVLALLALLFDLIQYIAAYRLTYGLLGEIEDEGIQEKRFDTSSLNYKLRTLSYWSKITLCAAAALWLVVTASIRTLVIAVGV